MTRRYLIITKGRGHLITPYLVEMSVRCGVLHGASFINMYNPYVVWLHDDACAVIRALLANPPLFQRYHRVVKLVFVERLEACETSLRKFREAQDVAIEAIIIYEARILTKRDRGTRSRKNDYTWVISRSSSLRRNRWQEESHMQFSFVEDLQRSMAELKTAVEELAKQKNMKQSM
jgi:hypothetical protein